MKLLLSCAARAPGIAYPLARCLAAVTWAVAPNLRARLIRNAQPFAYRPEAARAAARRALANTVEYYVDVAVATRRTPHQIDARLVIESAERLAALGPGRPRILISAHCAGAELATRALLVRGLDFLGLVEPLQPPERSRQLLELRRRGGGRFVESSRAGLRACFEELRGNGLVVVMGDRDLQGTGPCVDLGGRRARLPSGAWDLAHRTGATVVPVLSQRIRSDYVRVSVFEPIPVDPSLPRDHAVANAMRTWSAVLDGHLRRDPGQWTVLEDFWKVHRCVEG